jgi:ferredoxin--NADP+ reductase
MAKWLDTTITAKQQWTERHFSLRFQRQDIDFRAGQFVRIGLEIDGEIVARPYSLVNAPDESELEIYFNIVAEGPLTPKLAELEPGDALKLWPSANGFLVVEEVPETRHLWMLATGTGVGPFISILKTELPWQRFEKIVLAYSVRTQDELAYQQNIEQIETAHADKFVFVPVVTREIMTGAVSTRITSALQSGELEERGGATISAEHSHVMMCGNSEMIRAVFAELDKRGMRKHLRREPGHITTEKYH